MLLASAIAYDLVKNLYEFQASGTAGSGMVSAIAKLFGG